MIFTIELIIFAYLGGCVLYNLLFSVAGKLFPKKNKVAGDVASYCRIAILVPAYKEDDIILHAAKSYESLDYPTNSYKVIVIADSLKPATIQTLEDEGISVIPVSFKKSTKAKSLNAAFAQLDDNIYDLAVIADADNIPAPDFLQQINIAYQQGYHVIQGQRVAKNMDSPFAILDAANEIIANHINRKGANALGLSASIIGSGIAFDYQVMKQALQETEATGGFDKVLQQLLVDKGYKIHYLEEALIFDEKVENAAAFENQRKRWLSSQFVYLRHYFVRGFQALLKGRIDYFYMSVGQNMLLPRMLLLAGVLFMTALYLVFGQYLSLPVSAWLICLGAFAISMMLPLPGKFYSKYMFTVLMNLPRVVGIMLSLVFRLKGADKTFIHTKHSKTTIDNPLVNVTGK
ncbi:glycosyltransferase [Chitinophaga filiformis]|uniref:Glycosyltransferase, catalytic subunit of cellulose synthase and poly-beta-1,6-N-acetylglucosamine synthase n=1 Tax=Chitinophaga filiformis TaxID=104663 RepID=A0A1G7Z135_CHIFI|nr:glycosyltransferase family 2 protein [Chitinophaga filiformis]SDH02478.1 Glycosyltransferase, catalytic subunit of cellulose synthase and poly-beta-1,6-N-acetylglucosamine synthase [Chitinophaga filiformis]